MNSGFFYKSAEEREKLVKAERKFIEERVNKIIELKNSVVGDSNKSFIVINQKVREGFGIDWNGCLRNGSIIQNGPNGMKHCFTCLLFSRL